MSQEQKVTRKLKAIMSADVKGYSLLMSDDEVHTIQTLKAYRQIMSELIQQHSGRIVDNPGDNLLAEFSSAVDAVECAVQIQKKLKKKNARFVEGIRLQFRIGINIGDVVHDGDRIYGEGVNIAARIESLADAGGICISRSTYDQIKNKLELETNYLGEHEVKNIKEPVRVYKILLDSESPKPLVADLPEIPEKPSIAVLPFDNMSGDPSQEYFSDGLTEQIINGLCKVSNLFVIARNSSFAYKGKSVDVKQIGEQLGVRYILEGSVQRAGKRVRITAQLIDLSTGYHIWSENYDRDLSDVFALQDEITLKIIENMQIKLTYGEQAILWKGMTNKIHAYDMFMRGTECFNRGNAKDNKQARHFFKEAISFDESFAFAYAMLGGTHVYDIAYGWSKSPNESFKIADKSAEKAYSLNDSLDWAHILLNALYLWKGQHDQAIKSGERAIELNPNGADAHVYISHALFYAGRSDEAIALIKKAFRLNPIPTSYYYATLGQAYRVNGQYEKAIESARKSLSTNPDQLTPCLTLAASFFLLNRTDEAAKAAKEALRIDPTFSLDYFGNTLPYKNPEDGNIFIEALRKAGLPD
ncbi:tetratricopeptide repeat protein [bacterium]|nr:tetratricopeptide repeat protein [bacterium]